MEDQSKELYTSLLRGLAREAQDQLCATDSQHDWSCWERTIIRHDEAPAMVTVGGICDSVVRVRADRYCLNCGKKQVA